MLLQNPSFPHLIDALLVVVFGVSAALSASKTLKWKLLIHDFDGRKMLVLGLTGVAIGMVALDYTVAYTMTLVGTFVTILGGWIALNDRITNNWLNDRSVYYYGALFLIAYAYGVMLKGVGSWELMVFYLTRLTLPVMGAAAFAVLALLTFATERFKIDVLSLDEHGKYWVKLSGAPLVLTVFAGANPALVIALVALGMCLIAFGGLIAMKDERTHILLQKRMLLVYAPVMVALFYYSSVNF